MSSGQSNIETPRLRGLKLLRKNGESRLPSYEFALQLALVFRDYVNLSRCKDVQELLALVKSEGEYLSSLYPSEFILRNILCIITKFIREEAEKLLNGGEEETTAFDSLIKLWADPKDSALKVDMKELKKAVMGSIEEHTLELESSGEELAVKALDHITASDTVMTFRYSNSTTLQGFLKGVKCTILSIDDAVCKDPAKCPYTATSIVDVVSKMGIVTRVVLSAIAVLADGSCIMPAGTRIICEIAKHYSVPVFACSALYKFTPIFIPNLNAFNQHGSTGSLLGDNSELLSAPNLRISNPLFDHIPANLISLYITQDSTVTPDHVREILIENYHPADLYSFNKN